MESDRSIIIKYPSTATEIGSVQSYDWWEVAERQDPEAQAQAEEVLQKLRLNRDPQEVVPSVDQLPPEPLFQEKKAF